MKLKKSDKNEKRFIDLLFFSFLLIEVKVTKSHN